MGALQYYDAVVDDARHTMTIARTAATYGARIATRTRVVDLIREGERVTGARVVDLEADRTYTVRARQVVNATGVWTDDTQGLANERGQFHVRSSKGIHLVVPRDRIRSSSGIILRTEKSVLFVIPWGRHWIIGTTDTDWSLDKAHPAASQKDIRYLLDEVNSVLRVPLTEADVEGVYAGLRPLLAGESADTSALSREHAVAHSVPGLVVIAGGKYTTYRVMAKDAVDEAVHGLGENFDRRVPPSITEDVPLLGAEGYRAMWNARNQLAAESGLDEVRITHLLNRYGSMVRRRPRAHPRRSDVGRSAGRRRRLSARRGGVRHHARGCAALGRPVVPPNPDLDRDLRPWHRLVPRRSPISWHRCSDGLRSSGNARSRTTWRGSPRSGRARRCPTTRPPTARGWAPPTSCRSAEEGLRAAW